MSYDDFDRALLRAGKRDVAPARLRSRAMRAAAAAGVATAATTTVKAAAATKLGALATLKWMLLAAVTTASVGTAVYVHETEKSERAQSIVAPATTQAPIAKAAVVTAPATPAPAEPLPEPEPEAPVVVAPPVAPAPVVVRAAPITSPIATVNPPAVPAVDPLREELGMVDNARRALASHDAATALRLVDEHASRFPSAAFAVERDVIRIDALVAAGRRDEAATRARAFVANHPRAAQAGRIAKIAESIP